MKKLNVWLEDLREDATLPLGSVLRWMTRESEACPCCGRGHVWGDLAGCLSDDLLLEEWVEKLRVRGVLMLGSFLRVMTRGRDMCPCCWSYFESFRACRLCGGACECESCAVVRESMGFLGDICEGCQQVEQVEAPAELAEAAA